MNNIGLLDVDGHGDRISNIARTTSSDVPETAERIFMNEEKVCGTCRWHNWDDDVDYICDNHDSDNYGDYIFYHDTCEEWEECDNA